MCYMELVYNASIFFYDDQYVQPCLKKNPKYTFYTIKSSPTLAYNICFQSTHSEAVDSVVLY